LSTALKNRIPNIFVYGSGLSDLLPVNGGYGTINDLIRQEIGNNSNSLFVSYDLASGLHTESHHWKIQSRHVSHPDA
jgi:hypothetical protein